MSQCFVEDTSGADECQIKRARLNWGLVEVGRSARCVEESLVLPLALIVSVYRDPVLVLSLFGIEKELFCGVSGGRS